MLSRVELRLVAERLLRGVVIAALAALLWQSLRASDDAGGSVIRSRGVVGTSLAGWSSAAKAPDRIQLQLDNVPTRVERAWLAALMGAGSTISWSGELPATMIASHPVAAPTGGTRILLAAPRSAHVALSDDIGPIDTVTPQASAAAITLGASADRILASVAGTTASAIQADSILLRKVLVIGNAGWESKFVVAALEEEGWKVDALIRVAPDVHVTQGAATAIDTSRYSAVIALDSAASPYAARVVEFVRSGGGVVLEPEAATLNALSPLSSGGSARPSPLNGPQNSVVSLSTLALSPVTALRTDAIPMERRGGAVAIAARRIGAGRALQVGYEDTWRWRMTGGDSAVRNHRQWWTELVGNVAYAPRIPRSSVTLPRVNIAAAANSGEAGDAAPLADLVTNVGPRASTAVMTRSGKSSDSSTWLFGLFAAALLTEVASRRLRGAA
jgi:hypothetical protein